MLTQPMADEIRKLRTSKVRPSDIAALVGVSVRTVQSVLAGETRGRALSPREQFEADAQAGWAALCMDASEWADWRASASFTGTFSEQAARPCTDCPLGFAADMRAQGKCNGTPGGVQHDEDLEEVDQEERAMDPVIPITVDRRVDVAVAAPCVTCVHAGICRIQPSLEALARLAVSLPVLDSAVQVELSARVGCSHWAKAKTQPKRPEGGDEPAGYSPAGRKLNLSDEERERRRQQALRNVEAQRAARQAAAS